jgi:hypothetical protein
LVRQILAGRVLQSLGFEVFASSRSARSGVASPQSRRFHSLRLKKLELTALINEREAQASTVQELIVRARSGFKSVYGPDSTQYEQAGGTRKSDRKRPVRKAGSEAKKAA